MVRIMKKDGNRLEGIGERITVRLTLLEEALGMTPGDPEIYGNWIASKAPEPEVGERREVTTRPAASVSRRSSPRSERRQSVASRTRTGSGGMMRMAMRGSDVITCSFPI